MALLLSGCAQIEESATDTVSQVADAAADEVRNQVCALVEDGQVSRQDMQVLSGLVAAAESAGVPSEIADPLKEIAEAGDTAPQESVDALQEACARVHAPAPGVK